MFRRLLHPLALVATILVAVAGIFLLNQPHTTHAQNSCDDPPIDTGRLSATWNLTDFCQFQEGVFEEIISGGVPRDGIPPIDNPTFDSIEMANEWLNPQSPVVAVEIDGIARAYPLAIMTRHEIVNDNFSNTAVAITFCPLCNSAIVFDRAVNGEVYRFGVSGLLRNSDLIMWDDKTQSWWQQFTGEGIVGVHTGDQLEIFPSIVVGYSEFVEQFPEGEVLSTNGRNYGSNPYAGYDSSTSPFLFRGELDDRLPATARVLAGEFGDDLIAYPFDVLQEARVINDTVGDLDVVAFWQPGATSALDRSSIDDSRDVGMAALYNRDLNGEVLMFSINMDGEIVDNQTSSVWNVFGTAISGELEGSQLEQLRAFPHFWFAWAAFHPDTPLYGES